MLRAVQNKGEHKVLALADLTQQEIQKDLFLPAYKTVDTFWPCSRLLCLLELAFADKYNSSINNKNIMSVLLSLS